ncbi:hypothetical protein [Actinomadura rupiterrae]|uniref:hypothetical protein n=1 Tax=Actinomadura rupiterrae TaxID=559627 RepID=UPI0020A31E0D|nr:hypothetical protein [Actinomadura rupiterrae]MCP2336297.1 hypothetical protein [Actinomadura rupiterrae]
MIPDELHQARQSTNARPWLKLDEQLRLNDIEEHGYPARHPTPPPVTPTTETALLLALCSADGRIREAALHPANDLSPLLPLVVIRAADWAKPVRDAARAVLPNLLRDALQTPTTNAATAVLTATHLAARRRGDFVLDLLAQLLPDAPPNVLAALRTLDDRYTRRLVYQAWLPRPDTRVQDVLDAVQKESDTRCRTWAGEYIAAQATARHRPDLMEPLLPSSGSDLRALALTALVRLGNPERGRAFLGDRSAPVRAVAQWAARRAGDDPAHHYRTALAGNEDQTTAVAGLILGLAESGGRDDAEAVAPFFQHTLPRVRAAAVRAYSALRGQARSGARC